jgi:hypothetical protein
MGWRGRISVVVVAVLSLAGCAVRGRRRRPDSPYELDRGSLEAYIEKVEPFRETPWIVTRPGDLGRELGQGPPYALLAATVIPEPRRESCRGWYTSFEIWIARCSTLRARFAWIRLTARRRGLARIWRDRARRIWLSATPTAPSTTRLLHASAQNTLGTVLLALGFEEATGRFEQRTDSIARRPMR